MSIEVDSMALETDVNPHSVDWERLFREYGDSVNDSLDILESRKAVVEFVDEIRSEDEANRLLGDARDAGILSGSNGTTELASSPGKDIDARDLDWVQIFEETVGSATNKFDSNSQGIPISLHSENVSSSDEGMEYWEDALERGIVRQDERDGVPGFYLSEEYLPSHEAREATQTENETDGDDIRPEVRALREESNSQEDYVGSLEGLISECLNRLDEVEEVQGLRDDRSNKFFKENKRQQIGMTELQVRRLQEGDVLSRKGVDEDLLEEQFGDDLVYFGPDDRRVRLENPDEEDGKERSTKMPEFENYCELEQLRLKLRLKLMDREQLLNSRGGKNKYRALLVWQNKDILGNEQKGKLHISGEKIRKQIKKHGMFGSKERSLDTFANRVMDEFEELTDGALRKDIGDNGSAKLIGEMDEIADETCSQYRATEIAGEGEEIVSPITGEVIS